MNKVKVKIKKIHPEAKIPIYATEGSAAFDLYSVEERIIKSGETAKIPTGICLEIEQGYCWQFWDRSGLAAKGIFKRGGLVDSDYRGEFFVVLHNSTAEEYKIEKGDRIAQVIIVPIMQAQFEEAAELSETKRGTSGFHSTGKK